MEIVNLTPHQINICDSVGNVIRTIQPTAPAARVSTCTRVVGDVDGIPVTETEFGQVENLPEPRDGVVCIVSIIVQQACPERNDLLRPDTGPQSAVRDASGNIIGVRALAR